MAPLRPISFRRAGPNVPQRLRPRSGPDPTRHPLPNLERHQAVVAHPHFPFVTFGPRHVQFLHSPLRHLHPVGVLSPLESDIVAVDLPNPLRSTCCVLPAQKRASVRTQRVNDCVRDNDTDEESV